MRRAGLAAAVSIAGLGLVAALQAAAQQGPAIPDAAVLKMIDLGLRNIHRAACDGFNECAPATPAEFENPPITLEMGRSAMLAGVRTAVAGWCGLDAERRSVLPMTRHLRRVLRLNDRQIALMAIVHGIQQSAVADQLKARGACDEATRSRIDAQLPKS